MCDELWIIKDKKVHLSKGEGSADGCPQACACVSVRGAAAAVRVAHRFFFSVASALQATFKSTKSRSRRSSMPRRRKRPRRRRRKRPEAVVSVAVPSAPRALFHITRQADGLHACPCAARLMVCSGGKAGSAKSGGRRVGGKRNTVDTDVDGAVTLGQRGWLKGFSSRPFFRGRR